MKRILSALSQLQRDRLMPILRYGFAFALSALVFVILWRELPPQIDGMKKVLVVGLCFAVNFTLTVLVLKDSEPAADPSSLEPRDDAVAEPPATVAGLTFSDPSAVTVVLAISTVAFLAMVPTQSPLGSLRVVTAMLLLLAPGYLASVIFLPKPLGTVGRMLFSAVFSAVLVPSVSQVLYWLGFRFNVWVALVSTLGLGLALAAAYKYGRPALTALRRRRAKA